MDNIVCVVFQEEYSQNLLKAPTRGSQACLGDIGCGEETVPLTPSCAVENCHTHPRLSFSLNVQRGYLGKLGG